MPQRERRSLTARVDDLFLRLATALLARDARPRLLVWGSFESSRSAVGTSGLTRARPRSVSVHAPRRSRRVKPQMAASSSASRTSNVWRPSSRATASLDRGPSSRRVRRISSSSTSRSLMVHGCLTRSLRPPTVSNDHAAIGARHAGTRAQPTNIARRQVRSGQSPPDSPTNMMARRQPRHAPGANASSDQLSAAVSRR